MAGWFEGGGWIGQQGLGVGEGMLWRCGLVGVGRGLCVRLVGWTGQIHVETGDEMRMGGNREGKGEGK